MPCPPPRYGTATVADLTASVLGALDVPGGTDALHLPESRGYVIVVVDGLGWRQLLAHRATAPFLSSRAGQALDATYPSTTATNLASVGTARPPGEHGLVGYTVALPDDARPFNLLTWALGPHLQGEGVLDRVVPEEYQILDTAWSRAEEAGIAVTTVVRPEFVGSGLTRAVLRGGRHATSTGLGEALGTALEASCSDRRTLVYAHHGALDTAGHGFGPGSPEWLAELGSIDRILADAAERIPDDVTVLVTADHGMLDIPESSLLDITDHAELLPGIRVVAGEARARQLYCRPGRTAEVAERWAEWLGDAFRVVTKDDAITEGWFGPTVTDRVRDRIGDVLVWALRPEGAIVNGALDPGRGRMKGMHGSVTRDEVEVPMVVIGGGA